MTLDEIADMLPWGFHDAALHQVEIAWTQRRVTLDVALKMDEHQTLERRARVTISPMHWCFVEPARVPSKCAEREGEPLWIDAMAIQSDDAAKLPPVPEGAFANTIYDRETYTFVHVCGRDARLEWLDAEPRPTGDRIFKPGDELPS